MGDHTKMRFYKGQLPVVRTIVGATSASEPITAKRNARNIPATLTGLSRLQTPEVKETSPLKSICAGLV
jgi:hypothetical protein